MYFKRSVLALVICGLPAFATPVDPAQAGVEGFRSVITSSRVNRATCADKRIICMAQNQTKTRLVFIADEFLPQTAASLDRFELDAGAGRRGVQILASNTGSGRVSTGQGNTREGAIASTPLNLPITVSGIGWPATSNPVVGAVVQPSAVPVPAAGYALMLALSLLLLVQRQDTAALQRRARKLAER